MSESSSLAQRARTRLSRTSLRRAVPLTRRGEIEEMRDRISMLEEEMQESRRLNRRLAELTDVVQELLVPAAQRDEEKLREHLDRYSKLL